MRHRADKAGRGVARQLRVGIECDHITNFTQYGEIANLHGEAVKPATKVLIEVEQFAALSFPSHPPSFQRIEHAVAVEHVERRAISSPVMRVQAVHKATAKLNELVALVERLIGI